MAATTPGQTWPPSLLPPLPAQRELNPLFQRRVAAEPEVDDGGRVRSREVFRGQRDERAGRSRAVVGYTQAVDVGAMLHAAALRVDDGREREVEHRQHHH